jgi:hypothetical protein
MARNVLYTEQDKQGNFSMSMKSSIGMAVLAVTLMSTAALAGPVATIDNVSIPIGTSPGGFYIDSENSFENLVTGVGQSFAGAFKVQSISDNVANNTYTYGLNGAYLYGVFDGFTSTQVIAPTATTAGSILFSGGSVRYYESATNKFTVSSGSTAVDLAIDGSGDHLWLSATPEFIDGSGNTLSITIPAGGNSLTAFNGASADALLDVIGGDAAFNFNTNSFFNSQTKTFADINFHGNASSGVTGDFQVSGTNFIKANTVPEPLTLSLFGAGLVGAAALRRRRKASKA